MKFKKPSRKFDKIKEKIKEKTKDFKKFFLGGLSLLVLSNSACAQLQGRYYILPNRIYDTHVIEYFSEGNIRGRIMSRIHHICHEYLKRKKVKDLHKIKKELIGMGDGIGIVVNDKNEKDYTEPLPKDIKIELTLEEGLPKCYFKSKFWVYENVFMFRPVMWLLKRKIERTGDRWKGTTLAELEPIYLSEVWLCKNLTKPDKIYMTFYNKKINGNDVYVFATSVGGVIISEDKAGNTAVSQYLHPVGAPRIIDGSKFGHKEQIYIIVEPVFESNRIYMFKYDDKERWDCWVKPKTKEYSTRLPDVNNILILKTEERDGQTFFLPGMILEEEK